MVVSRKDKRRLLRNGNNIIVTNPPTTTVAGPTFLRPFAADSMWNTPVATYIGASAYYGRGGDGGAGLFPGFAAIPTAFGQGVYCDLEYLYDGAAGGTVNDTLWYDPPYPARAPSGPGAGGTTVNSGRTIKLPSGLYVQASPSGVSVANAAMGYLDQTGTPTWWQGNGWCCDNNGGAGNSTPALGTSVFNSPTACADVANTKRGNLGGRGASGLSSVGGCLRAGELESVVTFPQHALSFTFPMGSYGRQDAPSWVPSEAVAYGWSPTTGIGTGGFIWPAITQDSSSIAGSAGYSPPGGNTYGGAANSTPWVWMGSLLGIRPADLANVLANLPHGTQQGKNFANTMCQFGGYISENAASSPAFTTLALQMDQDAALTAGLHGAGSTNQNACDDISYVFTRCYVVMNCNQLRPN